MDEFFVVAVHDFFAMWAYKCEPSFSGQQTNGHLNRCLALPPMPAVYTAMQDSTVYFWPLHVEEKVNTRRSKEANKAGDSDYGRGCQWHA